MLGSENIQTLSSPINCKKARGFKSHHQCRAMAFNKQRSLIVTSACLDIRIWEFNKGKLLWKLRRHKELIKCLIFSKFNTWFISSSNSSRIVWQRDGYQWVTTQSGGAQFIRSMILTRNEDELISFSLGNNIIVWKVKRKGIKYFYTLEQKHKSAVIALSLNENEAYLVSCTADGEIILWLNIMGQWQYANQIMVENGNKICFINEFQFIYQPSSANYSQIYQIEKKEFVEQHKLRLDVYQSQIGTHYFKTIYNKKKQIIIHRHLKYVHIIQIIDGNFMIVKNPIKCKGELNIGQLTEDGEYLVILDEENNQFMIYQISY